MVVNYHHSPSVHHELSTIQELLSHEGIQESHPSPSLRGDNHGRLQRGGGEPHVVEDLPWQVNHLALQRSAQRWGDEEDSAGGDELDMAVDAQPLVRLN